MAERTRPIRIEFCVTEQERQLIGLYGLQRKALRQPLRHNSQVAGRGQQIEARKKLRLYRDL